MGEREPLVYIRRRKKKKRSQAVHTQACARVAALEAVLFHVESGDDEVVSPKRAQLSAEVRRSRREVQTVVSRAQDAANAKRPRSAPPRPTAQPLRPTTASPRRSSMRTRSMPDRRAQQRCDEPQHSEVFWDEDCEVVDDGDEPQCAGSPQRHLLEQQSAPRGSAARLARSARFPNARAQQQQPARAAQRANTDESAASRVLTAHARVIVRAAARDLDARDAAASPLDSECAVDEDEEDDEDAAVSREVERAASEHRRPAPPTGPATTRSFAQYVVAARVTDGDDQRITPRTRRTTTRPTRNTLVQKSAEVLKRDRVKGPQTLKTQTQTQTLSLSLSRRSPSSRAVENTQHRKALQARARWQTAPWERREPEPPQARRPRSAPTSLRRTIAT